MGKERFHELDSLRAIASLGVICWHYVNTYHAVPFRYVLAPFYGRGLLMVDFFFVLSGFVLARAFWTDDRRTGFGTNVWARFARIYPLHLVTLLAVGGMQWYLTGALGQKPFSYDHNDSYHFALNALLLNASGLQHGFSFNAPSWSISTEFLVNVLFLGFIAAPRKAAWAMICIAATTSVATMTIRGVINGAPAFGWIDNDLVRTAAGFFLGVIVFHLHKRIGEGSPTSWDVACVALIVICWSYLAATASSNFGDLLVCYLVYPALILAVIRSHLVRAMLCVRPMVYLGEISYSIYLMHFPLMLAIHIASVAIGIELPYNSRWFFIGFMTSVIAIATVTYRWIELPGKRMLYTGRIKRSVIAQA